MPSRSWGFLAPLVLALPTSLAAKTISVDSNGSGDYPTIQEAIDAAGDGDLVLVAQGEYVIREPITFRGKAITVASEDGPELTIIRMSAGAADPDRASVVIFEAGETEQTTLEGFTCTGGGGMRLGVPAGGAIYCAEGAAPIIRGNIIRGNRVVASDHPFIPQCAGGGIYCAEGSHPTILDNIIAENLLTYEKPGVIPPAVQGAGVACMRDSHPGIYTNRITANEAVDGEGGGIYCERLSKPVIRGNTIEGNTAWLGAGICAPNDSQATIEANTIVGNTTHEFGNGGGIYSTGSRYGAKILRNVIVGNWADLHGAGIYSGWEGSVNQPVPTGVIAWNVIAGNQAQSWAGGGVFIGGSSSQFEFVNNTLVGNVAPRGGGIWLENCSPTIRNCIVWGNKAESADAVGYYGGSVSKTSYSDVVGDVRQFTGIPPWTPSRTPTELCHHRGNICQDSEFVDPDQGVYELKPTSPCIDAGDPADSLDPDGTRADMGAFYFDQSPLPLFRRGDVNGDGKLSLADPLTYLQGFLFQQDGKLPCADAADADDDGQLGLTDAVYLLSFIFLSAEERPEIPAPYPGCGVDPTRDQNHEFAETGVCVYGGCGE